MKKNVMLGIMLTLLFVSVLTLALNIQPTKASGTIYIRADGSIDPSTAPISTVDNVTYTFTDDLCIPSYSFGVIVQRDNIVIDGKGYSILGEDGEDAPYSGIDLSDRNNITVRNITIKAFTWNIYFSNSSNINIFGNNITEAKQNGIYASYSSNVIISGNNITNNRDAALTFNLSFNITISANNIINNGLFLATVSNSTVSGNNIAGRGIILWDSSNNTVSGNKITSSNTVGLTLIGDKGSLNNIIYGNNITHNYVGVSIPFSPEKTFSYNNKFYHNNFINNSWQVYTATSDYANLWDDDYPSGGNYWSDYAGRDLDGDGIGDTPYIIDENNKDRYPLMGPFNALDAGVWGGVAYTVDVVSNSTVGGLIFDPREGPFISFNVTGADGTKGFGRVTIPKKLLWADEGEWAVLIGDKEVNYTLTLDERNTYLYFTYIHSTKAVLIQGTQTLPIYYLNITSTEGGTTNPAPGTYTDVNGTHVSVTAIPSTGFSFDCWLLDGEVRTENPIMIVMDANHTLEAHFTDDIPPEIGTPMQDPPEDVEPHQTVTVTVNVTDFGTGVYNVTLWFSIDNGTTWTALNMTEIAADTYQTTIPEHEYCTWVTYKIIAYDNAGNNATKDNNGYDYKYHVIPEFPPNLTMLLSLLLLTTITIAFAKVKAVKRKFNPTVPVQVYVSFSVS